MQIDIDKAARKYFGHLTLTYGRLAVKAVIESWLRGHMRPEDYARASLKP
jgi:hypothetical protein